VRQGLAGGELRVTWWRGLSRRYVFAAPRMIVQLTRVGIGRFEIRTRALECNLRRAASQAANFS
jgi:hypothetical protein